MVVIKIRDSNGGTRRETNMKTSSYHLQLGLGQSFNDLYFPRWSIASLLLLPKKSRHLHPSSVNSLSLTIKQLR